MAISTRHRSGAVADVGRAGVGSSDRAAPPGARAEPALLEASEAFAVLQQMAHGETLRIPPAFLAGHVLAVARDADWPVQRAAMAAVLRRCGFAARDRLRIAARPGRGAAFGLYTTRRPRESARPYATHLESLAPLRGSCDCPDYLRSSLGLCKHLLVVLDDLASRPRRLERAIAQGEAPGRRPGARLEWDPIRPFMGRGDWLARVRLAGLEERRTGGDGALGRGLRWFRAVNGDQLALADAYAEDPKRRAQLVEDLLSLARRPGRAARGTIPVEPALHALLRSEHERLAQVTADRADLPALLRSLRSLRRPLYPYQADGVRRFLAAGRLLLADDMGLGKTVQAVAACHALWRAGKVRRGLVVVPASLKPQWEREWQLFTDAPVEIVDGVPAQRRAFYRRRTGFLIVNYEQVLRDLAWMQLWKPDLVVLDEAQRIKNWATKTAACVKKLEPRYRLVLTGTPMENRLEELASILDWIDDHALEPKWRLVPWHATWSDGRSEVSGARNLETLRTRLAPCMLRRVRREILHQLPPRTDTPIPVDLTEAQREEHDALNQPIAQLAAIAQRRPLTPPEFLRLMKLLMTQRMISNGLAQVRFETEWPRIAAIARPDETVLRSLDSPKLLELREVVAQIAVQQRRKIVVFSQWRRMLALAHWAVRDLLEDEGLRAAFFTGDENPRQRTRNIVEFHDDPALRVLLATDAGGVGLNLQRAASCCVNLELPWNPAVLEQRIGRIFRLGQKRPIDVYNLIGQDCIESRIASLVADKRALFVSLFDGKTDAVRFERSGSFLATIERLVEPAPAAPAPAGAAAVAAAARAELEEITDEGILEAAGEREIAALVAAADESRDAVPELAAPAAAPPPAAAGDVSPSTESAPTPPAPAVATAADLRRLFSQLEIQPSPRGGIRIEAPAEAASALVALFEGLAHALRGIEGDRR
jgi:hypothetical protein